MYADYGPQDNSGYHQRSDYGRGNNPPYDGRRMRKPVQRRSVDYTSTLIRYLQVRAHERDVDHGISLQPTPAAAIDLLPPVAYADNPATSFCTKFVHASTNKVRCSINRVLWTPTGRRLITGSQSGEFTLWNGQSFNFEMILQAHDVAIRSMMWSHNENWLVTGDDAGSIKYWQANMNNVKAKQGAHKEAVRDLSFSSTDLKFASCSDDTTVKVWDFARCQEECSLAGAGFSDLVFVGLDPSHIAAILSNPSHGWDVKSVDWHPQKSLLVSGAKDNLVKLWDARTARELFTLHGHKNTVLSVKWNRNGNWVLTASRDQIIKLYDIRTLKELESYRGHKKEVTALAWHPVHEDLFVSGGYDGSILHWLVGHEQPQAEVPTAHESSIWDLAWHPIGHILCSGSNDHSTKFWCRNRPGETPREWTRGGHSTEDGHRGGQADIMGGFGGGMEMDDGGGAIPGLGLPATTSVIPGVTPAAPASSPMVSDRGARPVAAAIAGGYVRPGASMQGYAVRPGFMGQPPMPS